MLCKVLRANIALRLIFFLTNAIPKSLLPTGPPPSNIKKSDPRNSKYHSYPISTHGFSTSVPLSLNFRINTLKPSQSVKISHQILSHLTSQHHTLSCGEVLRLPCPNLLATLQLSISKLVDYYHFTPPLEVLEVMFSYPLKRDIKPASPQVWTMFPFCGITMV